MIFWFGFTQLETLAFGDSKRTFTARQGESCQSKGKKFMDHTPYLSVRIISWYS